MRHEYRHRINYSDILQLRVRQGGAPPDFDGKMPENFPPENFAPENMPGDRGGMRPPGQ